MTEPHRYAKEGAEAFEAFVTYRDMGVSRNIREVARQLGKSDTIIGRWSSQFKWVRRAHAWDTELDRRKKLTDLHEVQKMRRRQIKTALKMQELGNVELDKMLNEANRKKKNRGSLDEKTILKVIEQGAKLERLNRGEPGEIVQNTGEVGVDVSALSTKDLKAWKVMRAKMRAKQLAEAEVAAESDE